MIKYMKCKTYNILKYTGIQLGNEAVVAVNRLQKLLSLDRGGNSIMGEDNASVGTIFSSSISVSYL